MAISSLDGVIAGMQPARPIAKAVTGTMVAGRPWTTWALAGSPGAGSYDTTLNGVILSSTTSSIVNGQIPCYDPSGSSFQYLARFSATVTQPGLVMLCDRIWHNGGIVASSTATSSITTPTWPARDVNGSTNGDGIICAAEISSSVSTGTPTLTITYTNSAGTSSRTATNILATVASSATGSTYFFGLQAGDTGIRSIQSYAQNATWTSGTINLVCFRVLATLEIPAGLTPNSIDALTGGLPRLYAGTVPYIIFVPSTTTTSNIIGSFVATQG